MTPTLRPAVSPLPLPALLAVATLLTACGGGGGGSTPGAGVQRPAALEGTLNQLGVNTATSARQVAPGVAAPASYLPLGPKPPLNKTSELVLFGTGLSSPALSNPAIVLELTGSTGQAVSTMLHAETATNMPWAAETRNMFALPGTMRAPAAGDFDGDGLDETAFVWSSANDTRVRLVDDQTDGFTASEQFLQRDPLVTHLAAAAGDLDGDGDDELVIAMVKNAQAVVRVYRRDATTWVLAAPERTFTPLLANSAMAFDLATGNLDLDPGVELAIGISETQDQTGRARAVVLDDLSANFVVLREQPFEGRDGLGLLHAGFTADVAIGDFDADLIGEVAIAGVTGFASQCEAVPYFAMLLDDATRGLAVQQGHSWQQFPAGCGSGDDWRVRFAHCNAVELDGDPFPELVVNTHVFDDFRTQRWNQRWSLSTDLLWNDSTGWYERCTATMAVGDFTGDGREDLAFYRQDRAQIEVWSLPQTATGLTRTRNIAVPNRNAQTPINPVLLAANVDTDSPVLKYSDASYKLIYSEPIVLAALAAPPARSGIGQNVGACFTAFGNTNTTVTERERSLTFSASASIGINLDGGPITQSEFQLKATVTAAATASSGSAYELSKTIVFTSAPTEDTVVFTCVPIDRYSYTVVSHPDAAMIGQLLHVDLPRTPITLQAERSFYNASVQLGDQLVDDAVFQHTVGDLTTYPTRARKNEILLQRGGLQIGPQSVGQGGGSTEVTLQVGREVSSGGALAVGFEISMEATAGAVLAGVSVGVETTNTWRISSGSSTTYTGVVGAIDAANFAANRYSFGLFTYVHRDPITLQQFQVLNYWVE